jgi:glycine cleavage system aminomethyltransferase T
MAWPHRLNGRTGISHQRRPPGKLIPVLTVCVIGAGNPLGEVTRGGPAPSLGKGKNVGMGWVRAGLAVLIRNRPIAIRVLKRPMYKRGR